MDESKLLDEQLAYYRARARESRLREPLDDSGFVRSRLNDGREFGIVKVYYEPIA